MPPTDTTPESVFLDAPRNPAKSLLTCQASRQELSPNTNDTLILVEQNTSAAQSLAAAIQRMIGWPVVIAETASDALSCAAALKTRLKAVLITIGKTFDPAFRFIHDLRELEMMIRSACPRIFVLSLVSQQPETIYSFEKLGADYLLRQFSEPILESIRKVQWEFRKHKSLPTIVIHRSGGYITKVEVRSGFAQTTLNIGPRLRQLLEFFALHTRGEISTAMIADAMGLCLRSPKQYLSELRAAWDHAFGDQSLLPGEDVFITTRMPGGYVHRANARFEIVDEPEF